MTSRRRRIAASAPRPTFVLNLLASALDPRITYARASEQTYFDSAGTMQTAANDEWPLEYDPVTLALLGRTWWPAATNGIRNNTMAGAVAGTPGTNPTYWAGTTFAGLTKTIVGTGSENGITYIDVRFVGTANASTASNIFVFEGGTDIDAAVGQTWAASAYARLTGGSVANATFEIKVFGRNGSGSALENSATAFVPTSAALSTQHPAVTRTMTNAGTLKVTNQLVCTTVSGTAVDFTLRIGMPQLERDLVTPVIATSGAAASRAAPAIAITGTNFSQWFNPTEGLFVVESTPLAPTTLATAQPILSVNDGTLNNRMDLYRQASNANCAGIVVAGGVTGLNSGSGTWAQNATAKSVLGYKANEFSHHAGGSLIGSATSGSVPVVDRLNLGVNADASAYGAAAIRNIAYYRTLVPDARRQRVSL